MPAADITAAEAIARLAHAPLRNIVALKMLTAFGAHMRVPAADGPNLLALLPTRASAYDAHTYPATHWVVIPAVEDAAAWPALLPFLPADGPLICKVNAQADADALMTARALRRVTAFVSFTGGTAAASPALCTTEPPAAVDALFAAQGYTRADLARMIGGQHGRVHLAQAEGRVASACFTFANYADVHEIGGVYTLPQFRGRGLARAVVASAVIDLAARGLHARYQFREDNHASRRVAEALGMQHAVTVTHLLEAA